jgi:serine/threonine-protein kinase
MLLRRLASGLRAAHQLGVLHRDISPDNVLLESGRIERAKIVDFGIAKDLTPGSGTIIGEGFAGKLGYVAPEQLGDFNRELGPWTDIYSLALVLTAAALGHDLQMGGTLVDAVDRRRKGPDLTGLPDNLRPVFAAMLRPNPAERLRSMDEVLAMLDAGRRPPPTDRSEASATKLPRYAPIAGAVAAVVLLGGATLWLTSGSHKGGPVTPQSQSQTVQRPAGQQATAVAAADPLDTARAAIESVVPSIGCSWLDIVSISGDSSQLNVVLGGVARDPSDAQAEVDTALRSAGLPNTNLDASAVASIEPGGCAAIDAYRQIQNTGAPRLSTKQRIWNMHLLKSGDYTGQQGAQPIIRLTIADPKTDMTLFGIEPSGVISELLNSRAHLSQAVASGNPTKIGDDVYELKMDLNHQGWSGLILITGNGPFSPQIVRPGLGARDMAWRERFANVAAQQGWKADMLWFKVDSQRGGE